MKNSDGQSEFDWEGGERAKKKGIKRVLNNTPGEFQLGLSMAFWYLVETREPFTAEDARPLSGDPPNHPNAYSAVWNGLVRKGMRGGWVEIIGISKAVRVSSHRCLLQIYRGIPPKGVEVELR
jgi:hypothetical protein